MWVVFLFSKNGRIIYSRSLIYFPQFFTMVSHMVFHICSFFDLFHGRLSTIPWNKPTTLSWKERATKIEENNVSKFTRVTEYRATPMSNESKCLPVLNHRVDKYKGFFHTRILGLKLSSVERRRHQFVAFRGKEKRVGRWGERMGISSMHPTANGGII